MAFAVIDKDRKIVSPVFNAEEEAKEFHKTLKLKDSVVYEVKATILVPISAGSPNGYSLRW